MYLEHLLYFIEVSKCNSVNQAAKNLYISQPSLRAAIISLEKEFGAPLIRSSNQGIVLTPLGEIVAREAETIQKSYDLCKSAAAYINRAQAINIASLHAPISFISIDLYRIVKEKYPELTLNFLPANATETLEYLKNGTSRFGIVGARKQDLPKLLALLDGTKFSVMYLFTNDFICYMNSAHRLAQKESVSLHDLKGLLFLFLSEIALFQVQANEIFPYQKSAKNILTCFDTADLIFRSISSNADTFSFLGKMYLLSNTLNSGVVPIKLNDYAFSVDHYLISPADKYITPEEQFIKEQIISLYNKNIQKPYSKL